ncbi:unnamed protein product [Cylindrotheca closterium]|uniref:Uncharacterized protein n=1 Tax=Cylindrotheca closterium TaxID=2856 RepID=A0AAD2FRR3_9STRA|nr:unnamed protein product [Cylindrotheca closterium]
MDAPNESYTGYFNVARLGQNRVHTVNSQGHTQEHEIYDTTEISPSFHTTPMISAQGTIAIATNDAEVTSPVQTIRPWEALSLFGFTKEDSRKLLFEEKLSWRETKETMKSIAPQQVWQQVFTYSMCRNIQRQHLSDKTEHKFLTMYARPKHAKKHLTAIVSRSIDPFTTLPIPTGEDWQEKCSGDQDISHIIKAICNNKKVELTNPTYASELNRDKLEIENGILYQLKEPKSAPMRQLRRAVVPPRLRATIIAAYHASPMAGHIGFHKDVLQDSRKVLVARDGKGYQRSSPRMRTLQCSQRVEPKKPKDSTTDPNRRTI